MKQYLRYSKSEPGTGIMNFSRLLDPPAGKHGFVEVKDGHFFFEDGTRARFFGFDIAARSCTPTHEAAETLAKKLSTLGINVVRLHAADAPTGEALTWSSCKESPLIDYSDGSSRNFNNQGLDRFDYLVAQLEEKGIYLHIDLIVARAFKAADGLPGDLPSCMKRYCMYNDKLKELQKEYAKALLTHVNPYTGKSLVNDPAVMTVQINNEDSAIKGVQDSEGCPEAEIYRREVRQKFSDFLLSKYGSRENLVKAWTFNGNCALSDNEDPEKGNIEVPQGASINQPMNRWLHGTAVRITWLTPACQDTQILWSLV